MDKTFWSLMLISIIRFNLLGNPYGQLSVKESFCDNTLLWDVIQTSNEVDQDDGRKCYLVDGVGIIETDIYHVGPMIITKPTVLTKPVILRAK